MTYLSNVVKEGYWPVYVRQGHCGSTQVPSTLLVEYLGSGGQTACHFDVRAPQFSVQSTVP